MLNGELGAALAATALEHFAASDTLRAAQKPVCSGALTLLRLVRSSHARHYTPETAKSKELFPLQTTPNLERSERGAFFGVCAGPTGPSPSAGAAAPDSDAEKRFLIDSRELLTPYPHPLGRRHRLMKTFQHIACAYNDQALKFLQSA